jgi:predicted SAM-dependent methyltransferase
MKISKLTAPSFANQNKLVYYVNKYGFLHTIFSYVGRYNQTFWNFIGQSITSGYINQWQVKTPIEKRILNLGGGGNCLTGCLTVDIDPRADAYVDITKKLPFPNCSVNAIFCEEAIEHIDLKCGLQLLQECYRILEPGGSIRLTTPDLNYFASRVSQSLNCCDEINEVFYGHGHCYLYTRETLQCYCQEVGFTNLKMSFYQDSASKLGYLDSHANRFNHLPEITQYLEAEKPD